MRKTPQRGRRLAYGIGSSEASRTAVCGRTVESEGLQVNTCNGLGILWQPHYRPHVQLVIMPRP